MIGSPAAKTGRIQVRCSSVTNNNNNNNNNNRNNNNRNNNNNNNNNNNRNSNRNPRVDATRQVLGETLVAVEP